MFGFFTLITRSLSHYWRSHLTVAVGVAISAMVLTGTLIVGDSVDHSLEKTAELRLGNIGYSFSGTDRYFRAGLAGEVKETLDVPVSAIQQLSGIASAQGGDLRLNGINVHGIDQGFLEMIPQGSPEELPGRNEAFVSRNLADRLELKTGDAFLLRVEKASLIPRNAPFVSDAENQVSMRLKITRILDQTELGRFNLKASQTAPFNVFLDIEYLNDRMETPGKANRLLFGDHGNGDPDDIRSAIAEEWKLEDAGIRILSVNDGKQWSIESERVFLDSVVSQSVRKAVPDPSFVLTYLANSISSGDLSTPYSFVAAGPSNGLPSLGEGEIIVNDWLAEDLNIRPGDSIRMTYFVIGPLRQLEERSRSFIVRQVVPMEGLYADQSLMPTLPGLSDAGSCRSWETGIPIDLDKIRDKDEDYWDQWRGTPKAFISYPEGRSLWANRFGKSTAIRIDREAIEKNKLEQDLRQKLQPDIMGFDLHAVKQEGLKAAHGGVDFAELFFGMSFFLLLSGITLIALLFNINVERRMTQVGTLKAMGYTNALVRRLILAESAVIALAGVIMGSLMAILYNKLIFKALNSVWSDIVRTSVLQENIRYSTLLTGMGISFALAFITILYNAYRKLKIQPARLQKGVSSGELPLQAKWLKGIAIVLILGSGILLFRELFAAQGLNTGIFFLAGGLLLLASLMMYAAFLYQYKEGKLREFSFAGLAWSNLQRNRPRSIRIVILFALGTFVIVATGLNQKDLYSDATSKSSGTGGFAFFAETTLPVLQDLNEQSTRLNFGLDEPFHFVQMRKTDGDDASCLNLNLISHPRILGIPTQALKGRFSFIRTTDDFDVDLDWVSLQKELPGGVVPAIADQTVIQWGLGKKVGDTIIYKNEFGENMPVKLIGGLENSIFQGNILIDEKLFLTHFPSSSGSHVFLIDYGDVDLEEAEENLQRSFRNAGLDLEYTADRLAKFNTVENTYLSIFLLLGGLGMILGTIGLGLSLIRNIQDRQQELAILRAVGYRKTSILNMLATEHIVLLGIGTCIGALSAFIATVPSIFSAFIDASWQTAAVIVLLIFLNGLIWIYLIGRSNMSKNMVAALRAE